MINKLLKKSRAKPEMQNRVSKKFGEYQQSKPLQMSLFEFIEETDVLTSRAGYSNYSRSVELYDFMPKYVWKGQEKLRRENNGLLPVLEREFECRKKSYTINFCTGQNVITRILSAS